MNKAWLNIIILAYRRPKSLQRLLKSLELAFEGCNYQIDITFSLDGNYDIENERMIDEFGWSHGTIEKHRNNSNLGVDQHFLQCIERCCSQAFTLILEDDNFLVTAVQTYLPFLREQTSAFAGASLHHYPIHPNTDLPFLSLQNGNDFYAAKRISSRGLLLTSNQAKAFIKWKENYLADNFKAAFPSYLKKYTDKVWETLFGKFLIETDQYVLFPHQSVLSVFGDKGVHFRQSDDRFIAQSPLTIQKSNSLILDHPIIHYDAWLEIEASSLIQLCDHLKTYDFEIDLYGTKNRIDKPFVLTTKELRNPIYKYGMDLKPIELNVVYQIDGSEIYFGKTENRLPDTNARKAKRKLLLRWYYHQRYGTIELLFHFWQRLLNNRFYQTTSFRKKS